MRKDLVSIMALAALIGSACTSPPPPPQPAEVDTAAIRMSGEQRLAAISAGDTQGYLAAYADDAVWMPPNTDDIVGKELAQARLAGSTADTTIQAWSETMEQQVLSPDWVVERGKYTVIRTPKTGGSGTTEVGTYFTVWKRQADQTFKIAYDIWHSDRAPEAEK